MDILLRLLEIQPPFDFIETILCKNSTELTIAKSVYNIFNEIKQNHSVDEQLLSNVFVLVASHKDHLWEIINTGHFSKVNRIYRQMFTLASLQKAVLLLIKGQLELMPPDKVREQSMWELDNGLLLGSSFDHSVYCNILSDCLMILQSVKLSDADIENSSPLNQKYDYRPANTTCELSILGRPSIQCFKESHFDECKPVILKDCMTQWPAMSKWNKSNYLLEVCKHRVIPIEIGKNYTNANWSQDLVKFEDFFRRQFLERDSIVDSTADLPSNLTADTKRIEYLAQHNLFDQIPALKNDIVTPEYCCITNESAGNEVNVDIKAWLGPEGTISPMHIDEKHNLLCQVIGSKRIILAAPNESPNLYPFDGEMLKNTSQIDAEHLDYERFPLLRNVKFYSFTLYKGEMLYIPPKWWHFVRSLSSSFSVSFWWE